MSKIVKLPLIILVGTFFISLALAQEEPMEATPLPIEGERPEPEESLEPEEILELEEVLEEPKEVVPEEPTEVEESVAPEVLEMVEEDEDITPEDLGVEDQKMLPDSPFYFVKNAWRGIKSTFTFNPVKKAELKLQFANEKIIEAKKLTEKTDEPKILEKALDNYEKELDSLERHIERVKERMEDDPKTDEFLGKFTDSQFKQQKLIDRIERKALPEVFEKIKEVEEKTSENFSEVALEIASPEKVQEKIEKNIEEQKGSEFKHFKNLEVLKELEEKVPEPAKDAIHRAQENTFKRFQEEIGIMEAPRKEMFHDYVNHIGGNEIRHMEIIHDFEMNEIPEIVREEMEKAKERSLQRIEEKMKKLESEHHKEMFLRHLEEGKMEDLRIIKELENNLPPEVIEQILAIKRKVEKKLIETIEKAESPEEQREFFKEIEEKFHDVRQMEVFKEIEDIIPPEKKEFFEKMKEKAMERMEEEIERGRKMGMEERGMIFDRLAGDSPEHIKIFEEFDPPPEVRLEIMKKTAEKLSRRGEFIEDPARLEFFKRKIEEEEEIRRVLKSNQPEIFKRLEERSGKFMEILDPERAREQTEKAKEAIDLCESIFAALVPELQKEILERSPYSALMEAAKRHLEKAEKALAQEYYGEAFGQATASLHNTSSAHQIIDEIQMRRSFEEERKERFEGMFEKIKEEHPQEMPGAPEEFVPRIEKIRECPLPEQPKCEGKMMVEKTPEGCPIFKCVGEIACAGEGEKVNRNPFFGPTHQHCCPGLHEIRVSKSYSICKREEPKEMECRTDLDCPQPLCPGVGSKCIEGRCMIPMCTQPIPHPVPRKPPEACIQVITPAISPEGFCKKFPTPCDVPRDWKKVDKCPQEVSCDIFITCKEGYIPFDTGEKDDQGCPIKKCVPIEKED